MYVSVHVHCVSCVVQIALGYLINEILKSQCFLILQNVSVFEGVAVCLYGEKQEFKKSVMLEGIGTDYVITIDVYVVLLGKYPHLVASVAGKSPATTELSLSFGDVPVGQTAVKWIHLTNISPVSRCSDWLVI